ncbi:MAG: hypothetical protein AB2A00_06470 [Myxococcota bacterium]
MTTEEGPAKLQELLADLSALGLRGPDPALARALSDERVPERERVALLVAFYESLTQNAVGLLEGEQRKMDTVLSLLARESTRREPMERMRAAYGEQLRGLQAFRVFLKTGDRHALDEARERITAGARAAQAAAKGSG